MARLLGEDAKSCHFAAQGTIVVGALLPAPS